MDELLRILHRRYRQDPNLENATIYINALERSLAGLSDPSPLYDIWISSVLGLYDPNGVNIAVYDSIHDLTLLIFGEEAARDLRRVVDGTDNAFYLPEGSETWLDDYLEKLNFVCQSPNCEHEHPGCAAMVGTGDHCKCYGCYEYDGVEGPIWLCWHHYQIMQGGNRIAFRIDCPGHNF